MKTNHLTRHVAALLAYSLMLLCILFLARVAFTIKYVSVQDLQATLAFLPSVFFNALRFDLQVVSYIIIIPFILAFIGWFIPSKGAYGRFVKKFNIAYYTTIGILLAVLSIIDFSFYHNFHSHINIVFFDFFNEGPLELIQVMWQEYPVILYLLILIVMGIALVYICRNIERKKESHRKPITQIYFQIISAIIFIAAVVSCLRGSLGKFPLQVEDTIVTPNTQINDIIPNAVYMLKKAIKEKNNSLKPITADQLLHEKHFNNLQEALDIFTDQKVHLGQDTISALHKALFNQNKATATQKPNIIIICSESWSNYLLHLSKSNKSLSEGLDKHLQEDLLFSNFQSVCNGTIATIERLTLSSPYRLFMTKYRLHPISTSLAIPFHKSGYSTEFMSGMDVAWENCQETLRNQQFDRITGKYTLLKEHPNYQFNSVGIYDEYLFQSILERLNTKQQKPKLLLAMTTTNHPPFIYPDHMKLSPVSQNFYRRSDFGDMDQENKEKYIHGFQYYNQCLARFLDAFKKTKAAKNTIIVVTGDHNVRSLLDYTKVDGKWEHSVPLYIYLPPNLRKNSYRTMVNRWGCHYDILSTLAPFAFNQGVDYINLGNNLLDENASEDDFSSYNEDRFMANPAHYKQLERKSNARALLLELYFQLAVIRN